jgi:hypothetical protein
MINLYVFSLSRTQNWRKDYTTPVSTSKTSALKLSENFPCCALVRSDSSPNRKTTWQFPRFSFLSFPSSVLFYTRRRFSSTPENQPRMVSSCAPTMPTSRNISSTASHCARELVLSAAASNYTKGGAEGRGDMGKFENKDRENYNEIRLKSKAARRVRYMRAEIFEST